MLISQISERSENDRPHIFNEDQLFLALEYGFGGETLENYIYNNPKQAYSIWIQVVYASRSWRNIVYTFEHRP
ncbi:hypothetical protein Avbf_17306 [Armadillidium vulgare]|nr:hypothetical protein Avbf_17306 [Armadillidium vulgare]